MSSDDRLHKEISERTSKFHQYLLAANGAGIALELQKLQGATFNIPGSLHFAAGLMWVTAFMIGLLSLYAHQKSAHMDLNRNRNSAFYKNIVGGQMRELLELYGDLPYRPSGTAILFGRLQLAATIVGGILCGSAVVATMLGLQGW